MDAIIQTAQGVGVNPIIALSGASATIEAGKVYELQMTEDFTLSAATLSGYGESVLFVKPSIYTFETAEDISLDASMADAHSYRLLVSWTPYGIKVEQTGEWEDD